MNTQKNSTQITDEPIAIINAHCLFPHSPTLDLFWQNLLAGKNLISEVPLSRWNSDEYYDAYPLAPGKTNSRWGGFIEIPEFPAEQFDIKPRVAAQMDPQQKVVLLCAQQLLKNIKVPFSREKTGVFIGGGFLEFMMQTLTQQDLKQINPYSGIGMEDFSLSSRVAYHFGLNGPAMVIKTACSSSLVAIHQAVRALQTHDCDAAIAGGVNLILSPIANICLTKGGFLSPDGKCKVFDASANGYVRAEGCGLVLLKRLSDAKRDQDEIIGLIAGSAINQDGASEGITAPSAHAQAACYTAALSRANIHPHEVHFIEAHGTGTAVGDPIEMRSIQQIYDQNRSQENPLYVGAIKSMMGHAEAAAGVAGFLKAMLVLKHQIVPQNLHYVTQNPAISFDHSAVCLPKTVTHFSSPCHYAAVSSFGVAGTNVHMILKKL